jgi:type III secretion protein J
MNWQRILSKFFFLSLFLIASVSCEKKIIIQNVTQKEANEILVILASKDIIAEKAEAVSSGGGNKELVFSIKVDPDQSMEAMAILNKFGLPRKKEQSLLQIFTGSGLVPSEQEQKIRYQEGLAAQLASTIRKIDGIIDADVQASFPKEVDTPGQAVKEKKVTASVFVKHDGILDDPNTHFITKIKRLVASSIDGLAFEDVTVISIPAKFSNISLDSLPGALPESEKEYVEVWGVTVEKKSLSYFRFLFGILLGSVILLLILYTIVLRKIGPLLKSHKLKYRQLFKKGKLLKTKGSKKKKSDSPQSVEEYSEDFEDDDNEKVYDDDDEHDDEDDEDDEDHDEDDDTKKSK